MASLQPWDVCEGRVSFHVLLVLLFHRNGKFLQIRLWEEKSDKKPIDPLPELLFIGQLGDIILFISHLKYFLFRTSGKLIWKKRK